MFTSNNTMGKNNICNFECEVITVARWTGLNISEMVDLLGF